MKSDIENYLSVFKSVGIKNGDVVWVTSDIRRFCILYTRKYKAVLTPDDIIEGLKNMVGESGTLLIPTFNWDFCRGLTFDYYNSPCQTGSLGSAALKRNDFRRTQHPIYSFAVYGKYQDELCAMNNISSFGNDSPFAWLDKKKAKQLFIDVPITPPDYGIGFTFVHYIEQMSGIVTYRYEKKFTARYIDSLRNETVKTYSMFVRDLDLNVRNRLIGIYMIMSELGIMHHYIYNEIDFRLINLHASVAPILDDIRYNRSKSICMFVGQ